MKTEMSWRIQDLPSDASLKSNACKQKCGLPKRVTAKGKAQGISWALPQFFSNEEQVRMEIWSERFVLFFFLIHNLIFNDKRSNKGVSWDNRGNISKPKGTQSSPTPALAVTFGDHHPTPHDSYFFTFSQRQGKQ